MQALSITELIPVLQIAIGPVILISGVGLLLLTMANRLGRVVDFARILSREFPAAKQEIDRAKIIAQIQILWKRARIIRFAITLASTSALVAAILIIVLFFIALWHMETAWLIGVLFTICMVCLIGSLILFIRDINHSLEALKLDLKADGFDEI